MYPGDQAWAYFPVVYIYGVPVLPFPVMDVLKPQKTGLLFTTPNHTAQNGWQVAQPVYFALAPNFDLTVSPGYTFGASDEVAHPIGIRGPSLDTEVRWTHSRDTRGDLELLVFDDLKPNRDPRSLQYYQDVAGAPGSILEERRGFRGSLNGFVTQALGGYWSARVDVNLVSDSAVVKDTVTDVAQQANQYLRSSAVLSRRTDDSLLTIEATAQQDTFWGGFSVLDGDRWPYPLTGLDPHQDAPARRQQPLPVLVSRPGRQSRPVAPRAGDLQKLPTCGRAP